MRVFLAEIILDQLRTQGSQVMHEGCVGPFRAGFKPLIFEQPTGLYLFPVEIPQACLDLKRRPCRAPQPAFGERLFPLLNRRLS